MNDGRKIVDAEAGRGSSGYGTTDEWTAANARSAGDAASNNLFEKLTDAPAACI